VLSIAPEPSPPYRLFAHTETGAGQGLHLSEDHGDTWRQADAPLIGEMIEQILFALDDPAVLYSGAHEGLSRSPDGAQSWARASDPLGQVPVYSLDAVKAGERVILYVGTTGGAVEDIDPQLHRISANQTLISAGVYRYTTRRIKRLYLPLVLRAFAP
jgi:hypothetical protein